MTCYSPLIRIEHKKSFVKNKKQTHIKCPNGQKIHANYIIVPESKVKEKGLEYYVQDNEEYKHQRIPCGNCIGCRLEYSKQWATRCMLEAQYYTDNWFITLTYDDEHLPKKEEILEKETGEIHKIENENGTLVPEDLSKFMKHLRKHWERKYNHNGIRFYGCGEYGTEGQRPHFHIIVFNLPIPAEKMKVIGVNKEYKPYYKVEEIEKIWGKGLVNVAGVEWSSCAYVARYVTKKWKGQGADQNYIKKNQVPEFVRMSRMPGIGRNYFEEHKEDIYKLDEILQKMGIDGKARAVKPPKYYDKLFHEIEPIKMIEVRTKREKQQKEAEKIKLSRSSVKLQDQLALEKATKISQAKKLVRPL